MKNLLFSICIPVRDDPTNLKRCLAGLGAQDLSGCEIIVCDDGSKPPLSAGDIAGTGVKCVLVRQDGQGPAVARNHLARLARGTYLFFIDADTVPHTDMVECARKIISRQAGISAFYGSYDDAPAHGSLVSSYRNLLHHYTHQHAAHAEERIRTFWCGCGVIRRQLFLDLGGLSNFYKKPSIEDIELGTRLAAKGIDVHVFPELQVQHLKKWTLKSWLYTDVFLRGIPWVQLMRATKAWPSQLNFSWSQRAAALAALACIVSLPLAAANPVFAVAGVASLVVFLAPNLRFFDLVRRKKGLLASLATIPLHMMYALACIGSAAAGFLYPPLKLPPTPKLQPLHPSESAMLQSAASDNTGKS